MTILRVLDQLIRFETYLQTDPLVCISTVSCLVWEVAIVTKNWRELVVCV